MRRGPKHKICRRVGEAVCGRPNCPSIDRPYPPGEHGRGWRGRPSEYELRLLEKQKLRAMYGIREKQFRRTFREAERRQGPTGENFLVLLESRLDNLVRRLGFALTIDQARQLVSHRHILVDGRPVDRPSYRVTPGQEIEIAHKDLVQVRHAVDTGPDVPDYLERDDERLVGKLLREPLREEIPHPVAVDERLVVEFYAA